MKHNVVQNTHSHALQVQTSFAFNFHGQWKYAFIIQFIVVPVVVFVVKSMLKCMELSI